MGNCYTNRMGPPLTEEEEELMGKLNDSNEQHMMGLLCRVLISLIILQSM